MVRRVHKYGNGGQVKCYADGGEVKAEKPADRIKYTPGKVKDPIASGEPGGPHTPGAKAKRAAKKKG